MSIPNWSVELFSSHTAAQFDRVVARPYFDVVANDPACADQVINAAEQLKS